MSGFIGVLVSLIVTLIIAGVLWWAVQQLLPLIPLGEPFATLVRVLITVVGVLIVVWVLLVMLGYAGVKVPGPFSGIDTRTLAAYAAGAA